MQDLIALLKELKRYVELKAASDQITDLCSIVADEARMLGNLRVVRGAETIARRANCLDRDLAIREIEGMISSLYRIRVF